MMKKYIFNSVIVFMAVLAMMITPSCQKSGKYRALLVSGQADGSDSWQTSNVAIKQILENSSLFKVDLEISPVTGSDMSSFSPDFGSYDVVVLDYSGDSWINETVQKLENYVMSGGGLVVIRSSGTGIPVPGKAHASGSFSEPHQYLVQTSDEQHPIMEGLPLQWMHTMDVLYGETGNSVDKPGVLATAFSDPKKGGTDKQEAVLRVEKKGEGRIFHTVMGTVGKGGDPIAFQCAGFIYSLQRGAEWAASGTVTQSVPEDLPNLNTPLILNSYKNYSLDDLFFQAESYQLGKSNKYLNLIAERMRNLEGNDQLLSEYEDRMIKLLQSKDATADAKNEICRQLSWMGTEKSVPVLEGLAGDAATADMAAYALARLK